MIGELQQEFDRQKRDLQNLTLPNGIIFLQPEDVLRAHFEIASYFYSLGEGIGGLGVKDKNLLESAVARQDTTFGGTSKWKDNLHIIASLFFGLIKNHPFHDANKRTALLCCLLQLNKISFIPKVDQQILENFTVDIAEDKLEEHDRKHHFQKHPRDEAKIYVIADFLQRSTRKSKDQQRLITFRELNTILHKFGYEIRDKGGNFADIVRLNDGQKVLNVGFPGLKTEVSKGDLKKIREATRLTKKHGIDDEVFYGHLQSHEKLIKKYSTALKNLANR